MSEPSGRVAIMGRRAGSGRRRRAVSRPRRQGRPRRLRRPAVSRSSTKVVPHAEPRGSRPGARGGGRLHARDV